LLITSRRGPAAPGAAELRAELTAAGANVSMVACDVADRAAVAELLGAVPAEYPLTAVFHAAGVLENDLIQAVTPDQLDRVLSAKARSARNLHELTGPELEAFVLFSSNAGVWGSGGQSVYAAANAYLDALAELRRADGLAATSVAWGAWGGSGLAAEEAAERHLNRRGVRAMAPELALAALRQALDEDAGCLAVADVDWSRFAPSFTSMRPSPLLAELPEARSAEAAEPTEPDPDRSGILRRRLAEAPSSEQHRLIVEVVRSHAAAVLGHASADAVPAGRAFKDLGFDSLTAVQLRNRLSAETGLRLPATLVFDHPNPDALAQHLRPDLTGPDERGEAALLAGLDRLDSALSAGELGEGARTKITGRLAVLLAKWGERPAEHDPSQAHRELEGASAEEIFDLIAELGKS
nr:SDR family NAD(P)-dependent oxidoreductase [Actinomycetota bacterium]